MKNLLLFVGIILVSGCASTPPICQDNNAYDLGKALGAAGQKMILPESANCSDQEQLVSRFKEGYDAGLKNFCFAPPIQRKGFEKGLRGVASAFEDEGYAICPKSSELKQEYDSQYAKGVAEFCSLPKREKEAFDLGRKGMPLPEDQSFTFSVCPQERQEILKSKTLAKHDKGLELFCAAKGIEQEGRKRSFTGLPVDDIRSHFQLCDADTKEEIFARYQAAYQEGLKEHCQALGIQREAMKRAALSSSDELPEALKICVADYPQVQQLYAEKFPVERKRFVDAKCSYQAGLADGQLDATRTNIRKNVEPQYCDATELKKGPYTEGYSEGWRQGKERICDDNRAYAQGVDDAKKGVDASYDIPALCPNEYQTRMYEKYQQGFSFQKNQMARD